MICTLWRVCFQLLRQWRQLKLFPRVEFYQAFYEILDPYLLRMINDSIYRKSLPPFLQKINICFAFKRTKCSLNLQNSGSYLCLILIISISTDYQIIECAIIIIHLDQPDIIPARFFLLLLFFFLNGHCLLNTEITALQQLLMLKNCQTLLNG